DALGGRGGEHGRPVDGARRGLSTGLGRRLPGEERLDGRGVVVPGHRPAKVTVTVHRREESGVLAIEDHQVAPRVERVRGDAAEERAVAQRLARLVRAGGHQAWTLWIRPPIAFSYRTSS